MEQKPTRIFVFGIVFIVFFTMLEATLDLSGLIIVKVLGRDPSLTSRVPMWYYLMNTVKNPAIGAGYESFWLGELGEPFWDIFGYVRQAHNGYLETYLNLGVVGVILLLILIFSGLVKIIKQLKVDYQPALLKLIIIVVTLIYNWAEAMFHGVNNLWLLMLFCVLDVTGQNKAAEKQTEETGQYFYPSQ